jgi:hypothetical protein
MQCAASGTQAPGEEGTGAAGAAVATRRASRSIVTRLRFAAAPDQVWGALLYYEQIEERPPLHLRLLLPLPIRTEGSKAKVGDEARCSYEGGHLLKRVTHVDRGRHYGFEVVEQNLALGGGLALTGGCYTLRELPEGRTEVAVTTRYVSNRRPGWLFRPIEAAVCHLFHRHLLAAMRRKVESS